MSLIGRRARVANALGLPCLVKGFKVEDIETPVKSSTYSILVERFGIGCSRLGRAVVIPTCCNGSVKESNPMSARTVCWPSCLAIPDLNTVNGARQLLDVANSLLQVVKICGGRVGDFLSLPIGKGIHKS